MKLPSSTLRRIGTLLSLALGIAAVGAFGPVQARGLSAQIQSPQILPKLNCGPDGTRVCINGVCHCI